LTPNESEALKLLGRDGAAIGLADASEIAAALLASGAGAIVLKLGSEGCFLQTKDQDHGEHVPGFPVDAVDTTAAGDTFNAALAVALAHGKPLREAAVYANAAAAISVTRPGAQPSAPGREEVGSFLAARGNPR
jgi:ribokinase